MEQDQCQCYCYAIMASLCFPCQVKVHLLHLTPSPHGERVASPMCPSRDRSTTRERSESPQTREQSPRSQTPRGECNRCSYYETFINQLTAGLCEETMVKSASCLIDTTPVEDMRQKYAGQPRLGNAQPVRESTPKITKKSSSTSQHKKAASRQNVMTTDKMLRRSFDTIVKNRPTPLPSRSPSPSGTKKSSDMKLANPVKKTKSSDTVLINPQSKKKPPSKNASGPQGKEAGKKLPKRVELSSSVIIGKKSGSKSKALKSPSRTQEQLAPKREGSKSNKRPIAPVYNKRAPSPETGSEDEYANRRRQMSSKSGVIQNEQGGRVEAEFVKEFGQTQAAGNAKGPRMRDDGKGPSLPDIDNRKQVCKKTNKTTRETNTDEAKNIYTETITDTSYTYCAPLGMIDALPELDESRKKLAESSFSTRNGRESLTNRGIRGKSPTPELDESRKKLAESSFSTRNERESMTSRGSRGKSPTPKGRRNLSRENTPTGNISGQDEMKWKAHANCHKGEHSSASLVSEQRVPKSGSRDRVSKSSSKSRVSKSSSKDRVYDARGKSPPEDTRNLRGKLSEDDVRPIGKGLIQKIREECVDEYRRTADPSRYSVPKNRETSQKSTDSGAYREERSRTGSPASRKSRSPGQQSGTMDRDLYTTFSEYMNPDVEGYKSRSAGNLVGFASAHEIPLVMSRTETITTSKWIRRSPEDHPDCNKDASMVIDVPHDKSNPQIHINFTQQVKKDVVYYKADKSEQKNDFADRGTQCDNMNSSLPAIARTSPNRVSQKSNASHLQACQQYPTSSYHQMFYNRPLRRRSFQ